MCSTDFALLRLAHLQVKREPLGDRSV